MVTPRRPSRPERIVVKAARPRSRLHSPDVRCVVCGAHLRSDHAMGDLVCDSHRTDGYNPRHDPDLHERILVLLWRAGGHPLNLYRALGCEGTKSNYDAVEDAVARLNASGKVLITSTLHVGFQLADVGRRRKGTMRA